MTSYQTIFDAFLAKIEEDEWANSGMDYNEIVTDWEALLEAALVWFKFPRKSLERLGSMIDGNGELIMGYFEEDLSNQEVQIIATLMKVEWLDRTIHSWENVKVMYDEKDFSQANLLNNFIKLLDSTKKEAYKLQKLYSRSIEDENGFRKPWDFGSLSGKNYGK